MPLTFRPFRVCAFVVLGLVVAMATPTYATSVHGVVAEGAKDAGSACVTVCKVSAHDAGKGVKGVAKGLWKVVKHL